MAIKGKRFALWGLAFKPNTDDMREAPARILMESLWREGASVSAYDPEAMQECQAIYGQRNDLMLCGTKEAALRDADAADDRYGVEEFQRRRPSIRSASP